LSGRRWILVFCLAVCAGCVRYRPKPLDPPRLEAEYRSRDLSDPGVRTFAEANSTQRPSTWPPASWDVDSLTLVAYYFSPRVAAARARYEASRAAVLTAKGRPNPALSLGGGWTNSPESPVVFQFDPAITLETAGKRGLRILAAERQAEVARLEAAETAWKVRGEVRGAMLALLLEAAEVELLAAESRLRGAAVSILERRLSVGEASRPEVDLVRVEQKAIEIAGKEAEGRAAESRAHLAAALGVPVSALRAVRLDGALIDRPPAALALDTAQQAGLLNRPDIRRSLAEYAVAEVDLRLEVAKQYPDVSLGPGYGFDEGHHKFVLGPSLEIPVMNLNHGPIAEAEARRAKAAAEFLAVQAQAIAEIEQARGRYEAALGEITVADGRLRLIRERRETPLARAVAAGESDRLALIEAQVEGSAAARARLDALRRALSALAALEDAMTAGLPGVDPALPVPARKELR
jgi:cobalt-zinc-cadmium efflux system outer membrane protein